MIERVHWHARTTKSPPEQPPIVLEGRIEADVVVVGGGMAGLAAAEWLRDQAGKEVVLLESTFCGGGATGRSSGFITPDSELQVTDLVRRFGPGEARRRGARHRWGLHRPRPPFLASTPLPSQRPRCNPPGAGELRAVPPRGTTFVETRSHELKKEEREDPQA